MRQSYMDYAMSVIIGRALPDVRDGLKPANRRVLYGMQQMGLQPGRPYRKCAKIVGEVMGNYHPHGDAAIYDTLVRMAQDFEHARPAGGRPGQLRLGRRRPAGGHALHRGAPDAARRRDDGGHREGDRRLPAHLRRQRGQEPTVLPTVLPNLLVNGAAGIAVGMATNIPPHNLGEVVDGLDVPAREPGPDARRSASKG